MTRTCFDCQYAKIDAGYWGDRENPPEEASAECDKLDGHPDYFKELMGDDEEIDEEIAVKCKFFKAIMLEKCPVCDHQFESAAHEWQIHAVGLHDPIAVCSIACKTTLQERFDREIDEIHRDFRDGDYVQIH